MRGKYLKFCWDHLEMLNLSEEYAMFRYKNWGIGLSLGWIEDRGSDRARMIEIVEILKVNRINYFEGLTQEIKLLYPLKSERLIFGFNCIELSSNVDIWSIKENPKYIRAMNCRNPQFYLRGGHFDMTLLPNYEEVTSSNTIIEKRDTLEVETLTRLLAFIDSLESI